MIVLLFRYRREGGGEREGRAVYLSPLSFFLVAKHERRKHKNGNKKEELSYGKKAHQEKKKKKKAKNLPQLSIHLAPSSTYTTPLLFKRSFPPYDDPPPNKQTSGIHHPSRQTKNRQTNAPFTPPTRSF